MREDRIDQIDVTPIADGLTLDNPEILVQMFEENPSDNPADGTRSTGGFGDRVEVEVIRGEKE